MAGQLFSRGKTSLSQFSRCGGVDETLIIQAFAMCATIGSHVWLVDHRPRLVGPERPADFPLEFQRGWTGRPGLSQEGAHPQGAASGGIHGRLRRREQGSGGRRGPQRRSVDAQGDAAVAEAVQRG